MSLGIPFSVLPVLDARRSRCTTIGGFLNVTLAAVAAGVGRKHRAIDDHRRSFVAARRRTPACPRTGGGRSAMIILDTDHISVLQHEDSPKTVGPLEKLESLPPENWLVQ
jgi:hypothetical protein